MSTYARSVKRKVKNVVYQYTDVEKLTREATSNDPWDPSSTILLQLADATTNPVCRKEIFLILWKRVNDSEKNWRHVYKALLCWEYLLKVGHESVFKQCCRNSNVFNLLKEFTAFEISSNVDNGLKVRKLANSIITLINDPELYKLERAKAIDLANKFRPTSLYTPPNDLNFGSVLMRGSVSSDRNMNRLNDDSFLSTEYSTHRSYYDLAPADIMEEERQLQTALEISKLEVQKREALREFEERAAQKAEETAIEESLKEHAEQVRKLSLKPNFDPWEPFPMVPAYSETVSNTNVAFQSTVAAESSNPWTSTDKIISPSDTSNGTIKVTKPPIPLEQLYAQTAQNMVHPWTGMNNFNATNPFISNQIRMNPFMPQTNQIMLTQIRNLTPSNPYFNQSIGFKSNTNSVSEQQTFLAIEDSSATKTVPAKPTSIDDLLS